MQAVGIVVEYNPFHNGHAYHLEQAKKQGRSRNRCYERHIFTTWRTCHGR